MSNTPLAEREHAIRMEYLNLTFQQYRRLRVEIERLKQQIEQGKRDAVPEELRSLINKAQSHMLRTRESDQVSVALTQYLIAAAPKQEK